MSEKEPEKNQPQDVPLPEPTLTSLATGLAAQAMVSLGMFPSPTGEPTQIKLHQAKHLIETINMLDTKTKGNQTEDESKIIERIIHELRIIYIAAQKENEKRNVLSQ
jgi:hypothetical protein